MPHSVEEHLRLRATEYDRIIRTFIAEYDTMIGVQVQWLSAVLQPNGFVIDLGGGTGALAYALAEKLPGVHMEIWDVDPKMLAVAEQRLSIYKERVRIREKSFVDPLPACDAVVASLALHHVKDLRRKTELYSRIFHSLRRPGIFLNGDITISSDKHAQDATYRFWGEFMMSKGITEEEVAKHFSDWSEEDRYFSLYEELSALASAGFLQPDCFWKSGPLTVFGGMKE